MEITKYRRLVVRMGDYESFEFSASVKRDFPDGADPAVINDALNDVLDVVLTDEIADAASLTTDRKSFIHKIGSN